MRGYDVPHQLVEQTLPRHRRAHQSAARHRLDRQQVRDRGVPGRGRAQARRRSAALPARAAEGHAARPQSGRARGANGGLGPQTRRPRRLASPISTIPAARSPASPKYRSTAASGQIKVHNFWCTIDCGVAVQPDNVIAQTESSIVYGLGLTLSERIIDQGRRSRAVELLRLSPAAHEGCAARCTSS